MGLGNETTPEHTTNVRDTYYKQEYKTGRSDLISSSEYYFMYIVPYMVLNMGLD